VWDWRRKDFRSTVPAEAEAEAEVEGEASNVGGSAVGGSAVGGSAVGGSAISSGTDSFFDFRPILVCLSLLLCWFSFLLYFYWSSSSIGGEDLFYTLFYGR